MATLSRIKSRRGIEYESNLGVMIILFVIVGGIVYYAIVATPGERKNLGIELPKFEKELLDVSPGLIRGAPSPTSEDGLHQMQNVIVDGRPREKTTLLKSQARLVKTTFYDQIANLTFKLDMSSVSGASVSGRVLSSKNPSELVFILNGEEVESLKVSGGQDFKVNLQTNLLLENNNLKLELRTTGLFKSAEMELRDIYLIASEHEDFKASVQRSFTLRDTEFTGLKSAVLSFYAKALVADAGPLAIELNGNEIYNDIPLQEFSIKLPLQYLKVGQNNIIFRVARDGAYNLGFVEVNTGFTHTPVSKGTRDYRFTVSSFVLSGIRANRMTCPLHIASPARDSELTILINTNQVTETFANNTINLDACRYFKLGDNTLALSSENDVTVSGLTLNVMER